VTELIRKRGIDDLVSLLPPIGHRGALREAATADALLVLQGRSCNRQIPAKIYEYLRLRKPILALTAHDGETAVLLRHFGGATILDAANEEEIRHGLPEFLAQVRDGKHSLPDLGPLTAYSRENQTRQL